MGRASLRSLAGRMNFLSAPARAGLTGLSAALALLSLAPGLPLPVAAAQTRPDLRIADSGAAEGRGIVFTVEVTGPHPGLSVDYTTSDGIAVAGEDYVQASSTLSISANRQNSLAEIRVPTYPDDIFEPDQTFVLHLSNSIANIIRSRSEGEIRNNDPPVIPPIEVPAVP
jgi:Calx-beta domain-containing protein